MMSTSITIILIAVGIVLCIALSAFFSATEMSLSSANKIRLENEADSGNKRAGRAIFLISNFDNALSTILIGNNLVNIAASSLASVLVIMLTGEDTLTWIATTIVTILVIIFGESIPKIAAKKNANRFSKICAPFIYGLLKVLKPLVLVVVRLVHFITKDVKSEDENADSDEELAELSSIIDTAEDEGVLDEDQSELLHAALEFKDTSASEVMTARVDMVAIDIEDSSDDILELIEDCPYTRLPVYEESVDNIIGTLHLNHLLSALATLDEGEELDMRSLLLPAVYVYKTMKLPTVLRELRQSSRHLAIVTDEYSGTLGVVTLEDVVEELVGEIWDESDEVEEEIVETESGSYEIDGDMVIGDFIELFGLSEDEFECESETAGGFIIEVLEKFPEAGDSFEFEGKVVTVLEAEERRVVKIKVE